MADSNVSNTTIDLTARLMEYRDLQFADGTDQFSSHDVVLAYIENYAKGLGPRLNFQFRSATLENQLLNGD